MAAILAVSRAMAGPDATNVWPQFRGPGGSGVGRDGRFPVHFGPGSNVVWKAALPLGHSSPCIWDDRIFLTGATNDRLETICLNRTDGGILWRKAIVAERIEKGSGLSSPASSTPCSDGERVYVYFGSFGLACYDFAGNELWRRPLPMPVTQHGTGTSPVIGGGRLLLCCDQDVGSFLLALDPKTGETAWRAERPAFRRGFSTPLLWPAENPRRAIVAGTLRLVAYELSAGRVAWSAEGLPNEMVASPVASGGLIYAAGWTPGTGGGRMVAFEALLAQADQDQDGRINRSEAPAGPARQQFLYIDANKDGLIDRREWESMASIFERSQNVLMAVRADGEGDVTASHVVWRQTRGLPYVPTPLVYDGRVYLVKNGGLASCFDSATGKAFYQEERLGALGDYYSSPVAAGGQVCVISQPGLAVVIKAGESLEVLARNNLGEPVMATPAIIGDQIYIRTRSALYVFARQ